MCCMREHIDDTRRFEVITVLSHQNTRIASQGTRVTRDIDNALRIEEMHAFYDLCGATARRIDQQPVPTRFDPGLAAIDLAQIRNAKIDILQPIAARIFSGAGNQ